MSDGVLTQEDFSGGMWLGSRVPPNTAYEIVNGLLNEDDGAIRKRGGSSYRQDATSVGGNLLGISNVETMVGPRLLTWGDVDAQFLGVVRESDGVRVSLGASPRPRPLARPVAYRQVIVFPAVAESGSQPTYTTYGGSLKQAQYFIGTMTWAAGSSTVTGSGTSWLANVDAGMMLTGSGFEDTVIKSVDSNTQLTMVSPNNGSTVTGVAYAATATFRNSLVFAPAVKAGSPVVVATVGSPGRLVLAWDNRVQFSQTEALNLGPIWTPTDYHELPVTATVVGLQGMGWDLMVFTTEGLYAISNMAYDLTDDAGNVQHRVDVLNRDLILLGDQGLGSWRGRMIAPCTDDVYLVDRDGSAVAISEGIRADYRRYVRDGRVPGIAAVYRSHYFLPIVDPVALVIEDCLVCRLDGAQPAWTRWGGAPGSSWGFAVRQGAQYRQPRLFGAGDFPTNRVTELTQCFDPGETNTLDADGTAPELRVISREFSADPQAAVTWLDMRLRYELEDAAADNPMLELSHASARSFPGAGMVVAGTLSESPGEQPSKVRFRRRAQGVRLQIESSGPAARTTIRSLEVGFRRRGLT